MKKLFFSFLITLICTTLSSAQKNKLSHAQNGTERRYHASALNANCHVSLIVDENTKYISYNNAPPNQPLTNLVYLEGTENIRFETIVKKDSINNYRYSVYLNDTQAVVIDAIPQKIITFYTLIKGQAPLVALDLGSYAVKNKKLTLVIYKQSQKHKINTTIIYNKPIPVAKVVQFSRYVKLKKGGFGIEMNNLPAGSTIKLTDDLKAIMFAVKNTDINFLYHIYLTNKTTGKTYPLLNHWQYGFIVGVPYFTLDASYFNETGDYELKIVPVVWPGVAEKMFEDKATVFNFSIQKPVTFTAKELALLIASIIFISAIIIFLLKRQNNKKLTKEKQQKEISQLQLNAVRSQLNPHFMFNALAGIQNLMNKNDIDNANRYLGKFARLTRNVLQNQELVSITDEVSLLEDYLQMEKLRFGFNYTIFISEEIDASNTEIPAMLLQPFVENAIKHGISGLLENGEINIRFDKNNADLVLTVKDNGTGFDANTTYPGLGLELSKKRIALLNTIYKNTPILLQINTSQTGTEVKISLTDWL